VHKWQLKINTQFTIHSGGTDFLVAKVTVS